MTPEIVQVVVSNICGNTLVPLACCGPDKVGQSGFKYFWCSALLGEDSHFGQYFSTGLKPPTISNMDTKNGFRKKRRHLSKPSPQLLGHCQDSPVSTSMVGLGYQMLGHQINKTSFSSEFVPSSLVFVGSFHLKKVIKASHFVEFLPKKDWREWYSYWLFFDVFEGCCSFKNHELTPPCHVATNKKKG